MRAIAMILELWIQVLVPSVAPLRVRMENVWLSRMFPRKRQASFASHLSSLGTWTKPIFANSDPTSVLSVRFCWGCLFYLLGVLA